MSLLRSAMATLAVALAGFSVLWLATDGGRAWTAESARRLAVLESPRELPDAALVDASGRTFRLGEATAPDSGLQVLNFIFTRCPGVCILMGMEFRTLQTEIRQRAWENDVSLLSLSFDYDYDDVGALNEYLGRFSADRELWRAARFEQPGEMRAVLERLQVIVIPEQQMGFVHNAAWYLIEDGRVVEIFHVDERNRLLESLAWRLDG